MASRADLSTLNRLPRHFRHSGTVVEVYRHSVLVWKTGEPSDPSTGTGMRHNGESTALTICNGVTTMMDDDE